MATCATRFAHLSRRMGQYIYMQKPLTIIFQLLASGMMLLGNAPAQQTPAASTPQSTAPAKTPSATTAKKAPVTTKSATAVTLKTQKDKASYALGTKIGGDLKRQGVGGSIDAALTARGWKVHGTLVRVRREFEKECARSLGGDEWRQLRALLEEFVAWSQNDSKPG